MKMIMPLLSPAPGKITYELLPGAIMKSGDLIARLDLDDPDSVTQAQPFEGDFPELGQPQVHSNTVDFRFKQAHLAAQMIMAGKSKISLPACAS